MKYIKDSQKLLLCQILTGKSYKCSKPAEEKSLKEGFDSHVSTSGKEFVIFDPNAILPTYVVEYEHITSKMPLTYYEDM